MFFQALDGRTERDTLRVVVQMRAAASKLAGSKVRDYDIAHVKTCTFRRHNGIVADDIVAEGKNLVEFRLDSAIHVKDTSSLREKFRKRLFEGFDHLGERPVLEDMLAEGVPGIEGEHLRCFLDLLFERFGRRDCARREDTVKGILLLRMSGMFKGLRLVADRGHDRHVFRLRGGILRIEEFGIVFFGFAQLAATKAMVNQPKDCTPGTDENEFQVQSQSLVGNKVRSGNATGKEDKTKDVRK